MKRAVVYYSLTGNTKEAAEFIAKSLNADLFEIDFATPLPEARNKQMMEGGRQATFGVCPEIKGVPDGLMIYDEIILGMPVWAGKNASPINTLFKKYDIEEKVSAVFTLSGGGDNKRCLKKLSKKLKNIKHSVALADRANPIASDNMAKLETFIKEITE